MAIPADLGTVTLLADYRNYVTGEALSGVVRFQPLGPTVSTGRTIALLPAAVSFTVAGGVLSAVVPVTNDPDYAPFTSYLVTEALVGVTNRAPYFINVDTSLAGTSVQLLSLVGLDPVTSVGSTTLQGIFSVTNYGAKGDNVANDTAAIQSAINAASVQGGTVYFPPGTFLVSSALTIDADHVFLQGSGTATTIQSTSATQDVFRLGNGTTMRAHLGLSNFRMNNSAGQKTNGTGIKVDKCFKVWLDRLVVDQQYRAFHFRNSTEVLLGRSDVRNSSETGLLIDVDMNAGFDWWLTDVLFENSDIPGQGIGINWTGGEGLHCNSVNLQKFSRALVVNPTGGRECRFGFFNQLVADTSNAEGIRITNTSTGNTINMEFSGCWTATNGTHGLLVDKPGTGLVQGVKWMGGRSLHNGQDGFRLAGGLDVHIVGAEVIGNSQAATNTYDGVRVTSGVQNWSVVDSRIGGGYNQGTGQRYAVRVDAVATDYYRILGNDVSTGNATGGVSDLGTGTHKAVANNV